MSKPRVNSSVLWNYFTKCGNFRAICLICQESFSYKSTTGNLNSHLKKRHNATYLSYKDKPKVAAPTNDGKCIVITYNLAIGIYYELLMSPTMPLFIPHR